MAAVVRMPELVTGSEEAAVAAWLVAVGDAVSAGQPIVEIETEKATVEYAAEAAGVVAGILLEPGTAVPVGSPIAVLATGGQAAAEALSEADAGSVAPAGSPPVAPAGSLAEQDPDRPSAQAVGADGSPAGAGDRRFASPLVRKIARERRLDLDRVIGTGPNGRIVRRDIEGLEPVSASAETGPRAEAVAASVPSGPRPDPAAGFTDVPHTGMRRAIARRLTESKSSVPHFYLVADCRVDALLALRKQINALEGTRVSVNDFVVKAVAAALQDVPQANAIWTDEATRRFEHVDISVAVSVPEGLLTPVLRGVERLSLGALSREIRDAAERARSGGLKQHELEGGSFSVSNLGMYGTSEFSAILNPPQAGILAVGAAERRPVVQEDGALGVATLMTVTLSADHRVLDGALAAEWLSAFQKRIEQPMSLLV
ncbi:pyruvate dehydrogenase complex dihydrolipoamide acetyltransferase [Leucobacter zeae]|nr:pyruvate dehydrogenase complex dihydrolipoamide acetyltransferase [Leucobacter zeae]